MSDKPRRKATEEPAAKQPPVSAHPAFPVIVALWFAALFGIGSMVLPLDLFERFAVASGLAEVYAAAQPPLGATARIAVALAGCAIGAVCGLLVARQVARANAPRPARRRAGVSMESSSPSARTAKRPISAHEELGEGGLDGEDQPEAAREAFAGRRRALAVTDESAPSDFLAFAPLPGQSANAAEEPLDLDLYSAPELEPEPAVEVAEEPEQLTGEHDMRQIFGSGALSGPPVGGSFGQFSPPPFIRSEAPFARQEWQAPEQAPPAAPLGEVAAHDGEGAAEHEQAPIARLADRPLQELGVVELVERFAHALQRHQASAAPEARAIAPSAADVSDIPGNPVARPGAQPELVADEAAAPGQAFMPAALQPFGFDDEDEDDALPDLDLTAALSRSRGPFSAPQAQPVEEIAALAPAEPEDEPEDEGEEPAASEYPSLLALKTPFPAREPLRIDDEPDDETAGEPVVVFPGHAAQRPAAGARLFDAPLARAEQAAAFAPPPGVTRRPAGDTEQALRDALEKLQKLSGAA